MKFSKNLFLMFLGLACIFMLYSCQQEESSPVEEVKAEISKGELDADVPALHDLHGVVYPLWHDAFPDKDFALIKELLPEADDLTQKLDEAELPGILRDKEADWEEGKENLKKSLLELHRAVEGENQQAMLDQVEAFHSAFEKLVRIIRPVVPELEVFHQEMYKLYHYYLPNYELENIQIAVKAMQEKLLPLKEAELPKRLAEKQEQFDTAILELEAHLESLSEAVKKEDKYLIADAVERVHTAYQKTEAVFD